ncbi:hypothetical protein DM02DRAFT_611767 [Periconia macrospinosa]|uniref:2EXR domain-containing protein n=1 Tax=Periconia macrospinosa TaxID=97972 RepID=A0A2V1E3C6_9PLEO|nr:hypothetical protein DM02DRAFT_611767 [Periconia macrospinosa]
MSIPALPKEIRLQIWSLVYHTEPPRIVAIETNPLRLPSPSPAPLTYNICHEARDETRFQAQQSNHLISLGHQPPPPQKLAKEEENPKRHDDPDFEIIYRYNIDTLLICDSKTWPRRPSWADIPTQREKKLRTLLQSQASLATAVFPHGWWSLFKQRCNPHLITSLAIETTPAECEQDFAQQGGPVIPRVYVCLAGFPNLRNIMFVLPAFRCLSAAEKVKVERFMNSAVNFVHSRRSAGCKLPFAGRKRPLVHERIQTRICVWRGGRLCTPQGRDDDMDMEKICCFVRDIPRFGRAMRAAVDDMAASSGSGSGSSGSKEHEVFDIKRD